MHATGRPTRSPVTVEAEGILQPTGRYEEKCTPDPRSPLDGDISTWETDDKLQQTSRPAIHLEFINIHYIG